MSWQYFIIATYAGVCTYLGFWLGVQIERQRQERAKCKHYWEFRSLDGRDHFWQRVCLTCNEYEKLEREDVPKWVRSKCKDYRG